MSDNLVKRLRSKIIVHTDAAVWMVEAADRIEVLEKACNEWAEVSQSNYQRAKAAEAKLAVVVEALEFIALNFNKPDRGLTDFGERQHYLFVACRLRDKARTTLAEIKGEQL